jgi:hypothetical protein
VSSLRLRIFDKNSFASFVFRKSHSQSLVGQIDRKRLDFSTNAWIIIEEEEEEERYNPGKTDREGFHYAIETVNRANYLHSIPFNRKSFTYANEEQYFLLIGYEENEKSPASV